MSDWRLGIDFGTSYTVAAIWQDVAQVVDIESNGSSRIPSSVYLTEEGKILVGSLAVHQSVFGPERFEPTPKRAIGEGSIFLGDRLVPVTELAAAVYRKVYEESCRQMGGSAPVAVRVTHPADWGETRLAVLREALAQARMPSVMLIPEPVAAAALIAAETPPGRHIAVYDFGGGTFDAAVLRRSENGDFEVAGPPAGRDPLGGEDIDQRIITYIGTVVGETAESWLTLTNPSDTKSRQDAVAFRNNVRLAKETLSEVTACQLWIPGLERDMQLTRAELDVLIAPDVEATVDTLETALRDAALVAADLAGIYLVGGSSRIPLVAQTIRRRLGVSPGVQGNPKSVVALGAAGWADVAQVIRPAAGRGAAESSPTVRMPEPVPALHFNKPEVDASGRVLFRTHLAADVSSRAWPSGSVGASQIVVDRSDGPAVTIRARDEPATVPVSIALATQVGTFRAARTPGYRELSIGGSRLFGLPGGVERRFTMIFAGAPLLMVERYLVYEGRAFVVACPASVADVADGFVVADSAPQGLYRSRFEILFPAGWTVTDTMTVRRNGSSHSIVSEHARSTTEMSRESWLSACIERVQARLERPEVVGRTQSSVLPGLVGEIVTIRSTNRGSPMLTKLGVSTSGYDAFALTITLPHREQSQFASLARQLQLNPGVLAPQPAVNASRP